MTVNAVRAALSVRLATITGLRCHAAFPQRIEPPAAFIGTMRRDPAQSFEDVWTATFDVFVCLSPSELSRQLNILDGYADSTGALSVEAALVASPTLAGTASSAVVTSVQSPVTIEVGGQPYVAAQFEIEVFS